MERSRKILHKIASASHKVADVANKYADYKDSNSVSRWHFQLEKDMRRISVACECLVGVLGGPPTDVASAVDVRVQDWLVTDEPQDCLNTLNRMESLLQQDSTSSWMSWVFRKGQDSPAGSQDKIKEVVDLFNSCKGYFHFLFSTDIWNKERAIHGPSDLLQSTIPVCVEKEIKPAMLLDLNVPRGHAEYATQEGPIVGTRGLPAPAQDGASVTVLETTQYQDGHRRREMKTDKQRAEEEKKFEEILKWLNGFNCAEKQDVTLSLRQEDTCKWLLDTTQYKAWRDEKIGTLWLRGKPGAGKSVLASFIIDSFKKAQREGEILTFFYCDFRNERSTSSAEAMRSIMSQLLRQLRSVDLGNVFDDLIKAKEWGGGTLGSAKELATFTSRVASVSNQKPLVVVDALDECKDVQKLIQALMVIRDHVRLFVTSRPLHIIIDELLDVPFVSMEEMADRLAADIELHISRELDGRNRLRDLDSGFKTEIRTVLCNKADGMFRWVQCSIDTLVRCVTRKEVRSALYSLPKGLDETYERILLAIDMETLAGRLARRALIWLVAALRPLRLSEVMEALSINLESRILDSEIGPMHSGALLDACGSLITYTEKTGIVILSHSSVKEYLMGEFTRAKLQQYHINLEHAHLLLVQSCMCYISICLKRAQGPVSVIASSSCSTAAPSVPKVQLHAKSEPLLDYALDEALDHFRYLGSTFKSALPDVTVLAQDIERHSWVWDHVCIPARWEIDGKVRWLASRHDLLLYVLVAFAPISFMNGLFRRNALKPKEGTNPLVYAAQLDRDEHARTLLFRGAKLNHRGWETSGFRQSLPIEVAFENGHYAMVTQFIDEGSTIPPHIITKAFFTYDQFIYFPSSIARVLSQTDEFAENIYDCLNEMAWQAMKTSEQLVAFSDTTEEDLAVIIRRFLQVADEHFTANSIKQAFLRFAVSQGYFSAARYLLTLGTPVPPDLLATFHHLPGKWKTAPMIRFLLDNGADPLARMSSGDSVLHAVLRKPGYLVEAAEDDILEAVKLLVNCGCNALEVDSRGNPPLHVAIERDYVSIARYLLICGTPPSPGLIFSMPLFSWSTPMIHFLVENGADVLGHTSDGNSLIHIALRYIYDDSKALETLKLLISYGCDPLEANLYGDTPLHFAAKRGHISVARYLLALGACVPPRLLIASDRGWMTAPMAQLLVENGADVLARTSSGDSVLHITCRSSDDEVATLEVIKLLVSYGCDPIEADVHGNTPLYTAVERGHTSVAQYFLTIGASLPPDLLVTLNRDQLSWPTIRMIRFVVENGVDVSANANGDSLVPIALQSWYLENEALEAVKLLIGYGYDPIAADAHGNTPLHIAVERGYTSVSRYLLTLGAPLVPNLLAMLNHYRSHWSIPSMVRLLVENGASAFARAGNGDSPLHIALQCVNDYEEISEAAKVLVYYGCNPLAVNHHGLTPLHIAVERGNISATRCLLVLAGGAPLPSDLLITVDLDWSRRTTPSIIRLLVENGVNVSAYASNGDSILHIVLQCINDSEEMLETMKVLIDHGCDPLAVNRRGHTPIHIAVERGYISAAQYLLTLSSNNRVPPDLFLTLNPSSWPQQNGLPMIRFLVENGVNVLAHNSNGDSLLLVALQLCDDDCQALEAIKLLTGHGCDPLEANSRGETPLHFAALGNRVSAAKYLLTRGANVLAKTLNGDTVLHYVTVVDQRYPSGSNDDDYTVRAVRFYVECGCKPASLNNVGETPLHNAVQRGRMKTIEYLLSLKVPLPHDILFTAIQSNYNFACCRQIVEALVTSGCDTRTPNSEGDTPLQAAIKKGKVDVVEYLLSVKSVHKTLLRDLLSETALTPPRIRGEMRSTILACYRSRRTLTWPL